jgi:hypothetical protein
MFEKYFADSNQVHSHLILALARRECYPHISDEETSEKLSYLPANLIFKIYT